MNLENLLRKILENLTDKQRYVIERRYGLTGDAPLTLEGIGKEIKLTRERIRQIEESALEVLRKEGRGALNPIVELACRHLETQGGVRQENLFMDEVVHLLGEEKAKREAINNALEFVFYLHKMPLRLAEDKKFYATRYIQTADLTRAKAFLQSLNRVSKTVGKPMDSGEFSDAMRSAMKASGVGNEAIAATYLGISKAFKFNPYGDFGLRSWSEIEPRGVRERAYLVMKKGGSPMHFGQISEAINEKKFDDRVAQPQTVHNELIKDSRFVLCGRGVYGLSEWGLEPGTVKDVITRILKKSGPLSSGEVVQLVKAQRSVKDTTIMLGLQDRKAFHRLDDGRYKTRLA